MIAAHPAILAAAQKADAVQEFMFGAPHLLWLLLLLIPLLLLRRRPGTMSGVVYPCVPFIEKLLKKPSTLAGRIGAVCLVLGAVSLLLALARPQWRNEYQEQKVSGIDIMMVCDLSSSMASRDMIIKVQDDRGRTANRRVDRLTAAKYVMKEFIGGRPNDRIGLVAFAGKAKLCCPLTLDHGIVGYIIDQFYLATQDMFSGQVRPGYIQEDGTAIGTAIATAATRLNERAETKSKIIILVTDGASNMGSITPIEAAKQAAKLGIKIFTIAIGMDERISRYTADVDTFDEKTLKEIAHSTGARYYRASSGAKLQKAFQIIDNLEKTDAKRRTIVSYEELFMYPLGAAALLLLLGTALCFARPRPAP